METCVKRMKEKSLSKWQSSFLLGRMCVTLFIAFFPSFKLLNKLSFFKMADFLVEQKWKKISMLRIHKQNEN